MSEAPQALQETDPPGAVLAERRAARGLSVPDVANRLKFASRQIEALEAGDYGKLPGGTFVRGMIRGYARLLEIDPEPLVRSLERSHAAQKPASMEMHSESIPFPDGRPGSTRIYLSLSALILVAVGAILYEGHYGMPQFLVREPVAAPSIAPAQPPVVSAPAVPAAPPAVTAAPAAPASAAPAAAASGTPAARIAFAFDQESWVEVRDRSGKVLTSQLNPAGSSRTVQGDPPFALVIGNASFVHLIYKDAPVDLKPHTKVEVARLTLD